MLTVTGFVACTGDFVEQPTVVDGASRVLAEVFGAGRPAHALRDRRRGAARGAGRSRSKSRSRSATTTASRRETRVTMAPRITIIGGGSYQWVPKLLVDFANTPLLARRRDRDRGHRPRAAPADGRAGRAHRRASAASASRATGTTDQRERARGRRLRRREHLHRRLRRRCATTSRSRRGTAITQSVGDTVGPGRDHPGAAQHPGLPRARPRHGGALPRRVDAQPHQPDDHDLPRRDPRVVDQDRRASATRSRSRSSC